MEDERERQDIRQLLNERWEKANAPDAKWVDGEEVFARLANKIAQHKRDAVCPCLSASC